MLNKKDLVFQLSKEIKQFEADVNDNNEKMKPSLNSLFTKLKNIFTAKFPGIKVEIFGSQATNLSLPWSEIDIGLIQSDIN